jgi:hypothetical protein
VKQPKKQLDPKQSDPVGVLSFFGFLSPHIPSLYLARENKKLL